MATYRQDNSGLAALGRSAQMSAAMVAAAEIGKQAAQQAAAQYSRSGTYRDAFEVEPAEVEAGRNNERRSGAILKNTSPHSTVVEWGTTNRDGKHILRDYAIPAIERGSA